MLRKNANTYFIQTYGCQMNILESEKITGLLESLGFKAVSTLKDLPDIVIINSCSVRQAAEDSVYGLAKRIKSAREQKPSILVFLTGCLTGSVRGDRLRMLEKDLQNKIPWVNYLIESEKYQDIVPILRAERLIEQSKIAATNNSKIKRHSNTHALVTISTGCDNFCTYCVVPYTRKAEISIDESHIIKEVKDLVTRGYSHITLLGQNVNSWGIVDKQERMKIRANSNQKLPFTRLLRKLNNIAGLDTISFVSSNPFDFTLDLVEALTLPKMDKHLHIAVQSGDNNILHAMNRRHTQEEFLELLANIRRVVPDIKVSTDLIVGFPGETDEQFTNTLKLCQKAKFDKAYVSLYSQRPGTTAARFLNDDVPLSVKKERHAKLLKVIKENKPNA